MLGDQTSLSAGERIFSIESREAIRDLIYRYAFNVRNGAAANCDVLFTGDATFETREALPGGSATPVTRLRLAGRDAIISHISASSGGRSRVCPAITNILVDLAGQDASSSCLMSARIWPGGQEIHGEYFDGFRLDEGVWRFRSRIYTLFRSAEP